MVYCLVYKKNCIHTLNNSEHLEHICSLSSTIESRFENPTVLYSIVDFCISVNICICEVIHNGRSFINIVNSNGARTLPWGIPVVTSDQFEHTPLLSSFYVIKNH